MTVLIKSVLFESWKIRDENIFDLVKEWPICLGYDVAGVVEQVGSSACHARVGDTVNNLKYCLTSYLLAEVLISITLCFM